MTTEQPLLNKRYRLEAMIGKGGMAGVYRGVDLMLERPVAVKVLRADYSKDPRFRERFRQEAKAVANLAHPNIVTVHDFGWDAGRLFIVMEYVPGRDLKTIIDERGRFRTEEAVPLMVQACAGIGYAHRAGLVHCDIKPHNILVTPDQRVKVADFGIARALASIRPDEQINVVWGSPQYFSPEQASGGAPLPASDVYSLGIVLYEMLTGRLPFDAESGAALARLHQLDEPPLPSRFNQQITPELEQIILKVLSKEPSARYRTADQLGRVLLTIVQQREVIHKPVELGRSRPNQASNEVRPPALKPSPFVSSPVQAPEVDYVQIDWGTVILGLAALVAAGGLVPFWLWIYLLYNPPVPR